MTDAAAEVRWPLVDWMQVTWDPAGYRNVIASIMSKNRLDLLGRFVFLQVFQESGSGICELSLVNHNLHRRQLTFTSLTSAASTRTILTLWASSAFRAILSDDLVAAQKEIISIINPMELLIVIHA